MNITYLYGKSDFGNKLKVNKDSYVKKCDLLKIILNVYVQEYHFKIINIIIIIIL